ncbi:MAG: hypothetical protein CMP39_01520 [Rickettsiales bacterium]|nr:hypothetical protein [Rickettsiales bacterium]|tara:strand:+ start:2095 stop:2505 length:411 start_codon:yes stop_codon:yes gene_type:complete
MNIEEINIRQLQINYSKENPTTPITEKQFSTLSKNLRKIFSEELSDFKYIVCDTDQFTKKDDIKLKLTFNPNKCILKISKMEQSKQIEWLFDSNKLFSNSKEASEKDQEMFKKYLKRVLNLIHDKKIKLFGKNKDN